MKRLLPILVLLALTTEAHAVLDARNGITFGPVFNWHFGGKSGFRTLGFDVYYWDYRTEVPLSIGIGIEGGIDGRNLAFIEGQSGDILIGASTGLLYDFQKGFGFQGSVWGNLIGGVNLRYRYIEEAFFCPGLYLTVPLMNSTGSLE